MAKLGNVTFQGESGNSYTFSVYPFKTKFKAGVAAVYFVTRRYELEPSSKAMGHEYLYINGADDLRSHLEDHPKAFGFKKYNANAICILLEKDAEKRREMIGDLWPQYRPLINE